MRYFKYIFRNVTRNKLRSILTVMSMAICLAMMTVLYGFVTLNDQLIPELAKANRMIVMSRDGFTTTIPITTLNYVRGLPGVKSAIPLSWYIGLYGDEKIATFAQLATDAKELMNVWAEFEIDPEQLRTWQQTRTGCIIDRRNAERRGWSIGEHIPLKGNNYGFDLDLVLCGVYDGPEFINDLYFHWDYLNEELRARNDPKKDTTSILFLKAESADAIERLMPQIDRRYENSDSPTLSQSHQAFAAMFSKFAGNLQLFVQRIGIVVVIALTLVAANTMAMSIRERTTEIAVLRAIGFKPELVSLMVMAESLFIALVGGVLGVATGRGVWSAVHYFWPQYIPLDWMAWIVLVYGVLVAGVVGLLSGALPAWRAASLSVIAGLRKVV
jgi:putative ABC transport system permease protein